MEFESVRKTVKMMKKKIGEDWTSLYQGIRESKEKSTRELGSSIRYYCKSAIIAIFSATYVIFIPEIIDFSKK